jgi:uncharacterized protein HemX
MRHEAIQNSAALVLVAFALGLYISGAGTNQATADRAQMQHRIKQEVTQALQNSSLSAEEKRIFEAARTEFKQLIKAQREGQKVDQERLQAASETMRKVLTGNAIRPDDRTRLEASFHVAEALRREERARARREALVAQLGYPMGLLADMVVSD